jgi:hypothetical protein
MTERHEAKNAQRSFASKIKILDILTRSFSFATPFFGKIKRTLSRQFTEKVKPIIQVDHAPDYLRRAVAHNIYNSIFFLTEKIRGVTSSRMAIGLLNKAIKPTPTHENTIEEIIGTS